MANTTHIDVVSAEEEIFTGEAKFVALPCYRFVSRSTVAAQGGSVIPMAEHFWLVMEESSDVCQEFGQ